MMSPRQSQHPCEIESLTPQGEYVDDRSEPRSTLNRGRTGLSVAIAGIITERLTETEETTDQTQETVLKKGSDRRLRKERSQHVL